MSSRSQIPTLPTEESPALGTVYTPPDEPLDDWPDNFGEEFWQSFREIGLLRGALRDLLTDVTNLTYRLREGSPELDLSPAAFAAAFARAVPPDIRDGPRNAALLAGLTAWFADISAEIVEYRAPRREPARAYQRVREENERVKAEREEAISRRRAEEARRWAQHEADHEKFLAFKKSQQQQVR
jgi:hypothetical protein